MKYPIPSLFFLSACQVGILLIDIYAHLISQVRDELENLLDDDGDMAELYLTDKLVQQQHDNSSPASSSMNDRNSMLNRVLQPDVNDRHVI